MLFKKLVVPMCQDYYTKNCSKLVFYKTDIKNISLIKISDKYYIDVLLYNEQHHNIPVSNSRIMFEGISAKHHIGTWYSIAHQMYKDQLYFLLEHQEYGDEAANIIVDLDGNVILDQVFNGFDDLEDYFDSLERKEKHKEEENTIHIVIQNGLIEYVYASNRDLHVSIIDLDTSNSSLKSYLNDEVETLKANKYDILG